MLDVRRIFHANGKISNSRLDTSLDPPLSDMFAKD